MKIVTSATVLLFCWIMMALSPFPSSFAWGATEMEQLVHSLQSVAAIHYSVNPATGKLRFLAALDGSSIPRQSDAVESLNGAEEAARNFLEQYGQLFGVTTQAEELTAKGITRPDTTRSLVRFQQVHKGVPVYGGELVVQLDSHNDIISVNGSLSPDCSADTSPAVSGNDAREIAINLIARKRGVDRSKLAANEPSLYIYNPALVGSGKSDNVLVWRVDVQATDSSLTEVVLVDAKAGSVRLHFPQSCTAAIEGEPGTGGFTTATSLFCYAEPGAIQNSLSDLGPLLINASSGSSGVAQDFGSSELPAEVADPPQAAQPDRMKSKLYYCGSADGRGVHTNKGVNNKAFALMATGGEFNGKTVTGIGVAKVARIYQEARANILTSAARYADLYEDLQLACSNLQRSGVTTASDCLEVKNAVDAVEMYEAEPCPGSGNLTIKDMIIAKDQFGTDAFGYLTTLDDVYIFYTVANLGTEPTEATEVQIQIDAQYVRSPVPALAPGEEVTLSVHIGRINYYGEYTFRLFLDPDNDICESVETDNSYEADVYVDYVPLYHDICGTVRSGGPTGPFVAGARVQYAGRQDYTNNSGFFCLYVPETFDWLTIEAADHAYFSQGAEFTENTSALVFYLTPLYHISGTVRSMSASGPVIAGAVVSIAGKTAITSSTGAFTITGVAPGSYPLAVVKSGYEVYRNPAYAVRGNQSGVVFALSPLSTISGTVHSGSSAGPVISGATISIAGKTAVSNSTGTFRITVPSGTHTLTISKTGYKTYTNSSYAVRGSQSGLLFALAPLCTISGTVRSGSATGAVVAGATVSIAGNTAVTSSTGTFSIRGVPAGTYPLTIAKAGFKTFSNAAYAVRGNQSGVVFALAPLCTISGTVHAGRAIGPVLPGAVVRIAGKSAVTSSTGAFSITSIPAGTYVLSIAKTGFTPYVNAAYSITASKSGLNFYLIRQ